MNSRLAFIRIVWAAGLALALFLTVHAALGAFTEAAAALARTL